MATEKVCCDNTCCNIEVGSCLPAAIVTYTVCPGNILYGCEQKNCTNNIEAQNLRNVKIQQHKNNILNVINCFKKMQKKIDKLNRRTVDNRLNLIL